jgi:hypothetical protein
MQRGAPLEVLHGHDGIVHQPILAGRIGEQGGVVVVERDASVVDYLGGAGLILLTHESHADVEKSLSESLG